MSEPERCDGCGYEWDALRADEFGPRLRAAVEGFAVALRRSDAYIRPSDDVWSPIEYACHARDVILNLRDRILLGAIEDNPVPHRIYADDRVALGLYANESSETVAIELSVVADLAVRTVDALSPERLTRPIFYPYPRPETRTLLWVASQLLHEVEHHLADIAGS
jgi:DinB superfamily